MKEHRGNLRAHDDAAIKKLTARLGLSISLGEVCSLDGKLYVTHAHAGLPSSSPSESLSGHRD